MSIHSNLSNFIDTLLLAYLLENNSENQAVKQTIIDDYKELNKKCDSIIERIKTRKSQNPPKYIGGGHAA
jgi:hypothetical protein